MRAEFFDIFGFLGFLIILIIGIKMINVKRKIPDWMAWIIILISLIGLLVDGYIVIKTYILV